MNASDVGLIIATVLALVCLRRRRCGAGSEQWAVSSEQRREENEVLMGSELERKPRA
jgi:hypothetical protein